MAREAAMLDVFQCCSKVEARGVEEDTVVPADVRGSSIILKEDPMMESDDKKFPEDIICQEITFEMSTTNPEGEDVSAEKEAPSNDTGSMPEPLAEPAPGTSDDASKQSIFAAAVEENLGSLTKGGPVVIVLVNPTSGGNAAGVLLKLPRDGILIDTAGGPGSSRLKATVFSYPIADPTKEGIRHLSREVHAARETEPVRCIVAGGDGTVMWAIQEIFAADIPIERVLVGTIPFGTGNDFGNVTRWGTSGPSKGFLQESNNYAGLHKYVQAWLRADTSPYDIWEVSVRTRSSDLARFEFIEAKQKRCTDAHLARHGIRKLEGGGLEMSKYVCNYVGFGLDARVGFGFDKSRQQNRSLNKTVYVWEGLKKLLFKKKGVIGQIMEGMAVVQGEEQSPARDGHEWTPDTDGRVFTTARGGAAEGVPTLLGNPVSLLFLNIPSISGGLDVWKWSTRKLGTTHSDPNLLNVQQNFGDGRLECLSYRTGAGFYLEQVRQPPISGQGHRIYSGRGPLKVNFRDPSDREYIKGTAHCKGRTYMQVDGEFFAVHQPESVVLKHHRTIRVLVNSASASCC